MQNEGQRQTIRAFWGLRALAFFGIFVFHFGNPQWSQLAMWGVSLFFVLSGFLTGFLSKESKEKLTLSSSIAFLLRRVKKNYRLHILMLVICLPVSDTLASLCTEGLVKLPFWLVILATNVTLTKSLLPKYYFSFNGVSWFLSTYAILCLLTPWTCRFLRAHFQKRKSRHILLGILLWIFLGFGYSFLISKLPVNVEYFTYICPIARFFDYGAGLMLGIWLAGVDRKQWVSDGVLSLLQTILFVLLPVLIFAWDYPEWLCRSFLWIVPNLLLLVVFLTDGGILGKALGTKAFVFLGKHSANMFLIHQVLWRYYDTYWKAPATIGEKWGMLLLAYGLTLLASVGYEKRKGWVVQ